MQPWTAGLNNHYYIACKPMGVFTTDKEAYTLGALIKQLQIVEQHHALLPELLRSFDGCGFDYHHKK